MSMDHVRDAYAARAAEYTHLLGSIEETSATDRETILAWAKTINGPIIDVGCGPGQWTNYLLSNDIDVEGVDPVSEFIDSAQKAYPTASYRLGRAENVGVEEGSLAGILSWYSLIHSDPTAIDRPLAEFARCLKPGGSLLIGFFEGPTLTPFAHAVTTAFYWPMELLTARVEQAGFTVTKKQTREDPGVRRHGLIVAERAT